MICMPRPRHKSREKEVLHESQLARARLVPLAIGADQLICQIQNGLRRGCMSLSKAGLMGGNGVIDFDPDQHFPR